MILIMKFISSLKRTTAFVRLHNGTRAAVPLRQRVPVILRFLAEYLFDIN